MGGDMIDKAIKGTFKIRDAEVLTFVDPDGRRYEVEMGSVWVDWERIYDEEIQAFRAKATLRESG